MKKSILLCLCAVAIIGIVFASMTLTGKSNSECCYNEDIAAILSRHEEEYGHKFKLATKKIENALYGKWDVGDEHVGISLKYEVTMGVLDEGELNISKDLFVMTTPSVRSKYYGVWKDHTRQHKNPVFAYYTEMLDEMAADDMLSWYSGIGGMDPDTVGTVVISMGVYVHEEDRSDPDKGKYEFFSPRFIIIDDYIIAEYGSSFYKLEKIDPQK